MSALQRVVRTALKQTGLRSTEKGKRPLLSDSAVDNCPTDWLTRLVPTIEDKKLRKFFCSIDGAARGAGPSQEGGILALALLYDDADRCANDLLSAVESSKIQSIDTRKPRLQDGYWSSGEAMAIYIRHHGNERAIALELGLNRSHVGRTLRAAGFPPGNIIRQPSIRKALSEFLGGDSVETVTSRNSLKIAVFHNLFRYNIFAIRQLFA
jgi:hypothetical protein